MSQRKAAPVARIAKGVHAHGCVACKGRYEDACAEPKEWHKCANCLTGRSVRNELLIANRLPIACCFESARPVRKQEVAPFRLYQTCDWFICPKCSRTFPFKNPKGAGT